MKLPGGKTLGVVHIEQARDEGARSVFRNLIHGIEDLYQNITRVVNKNEIPYVSQNDQPTVPEGEWKIWRDADAGAGQPKAYIVTTQGGQTFTFKSDQVV